MLLLLLAVNFTALYKFTTSACMKCEFQILMVSIAVYGTCVRRDITVVRPRCCHSLRNDCNDIVQENGNYCRSLVKDLNTKLRDTKWNVRLFC